MIIKEQKIDTKYLDGEEYLYGGDEFKSLSIHERDSRGKMVLLTHKKKLRFETYVTRAFNNEGNQVGYWIRTVDYKPAALDGLLEDIEA